MHGDVLLPFPPALLPRDPAEGSDFQKPDSEAAAGDAQASAPGERAQVHGHLPAAANLLLTLQGVHMVRTAQACWCGASHPFTFWGPTCYP